MYLLCNKVCSVSEKIRLLLSIFKLFNIFYEESNFDKDFMCEIAETFLLVQRVEGLIVFHIHLAKSPVSRVFPF